MGTAAFLPLSAAGARCPAPAPRSEIKAEVPCPRGLPALWTEELSHGQAAN